MQDISPLQPAQNSQDHALVAAKCQALGDMGLGQQLLEDHHNLAAQWPGQLPKGPLYAMTLGQLLLLPQHWEATQTLLMQMCAEGLEVDVDMWQPALR